MADTTPTTPVHAASATDTDYIKSGNNAEFVRLIKEAAIFRYETTDTIDSLGPNWKPASGKKPFGYFSEDGIVLHPESGDSDDFKGHNGDVVVSMASGGYWTAQFSALEAKKDVVETYFDAKVAADGSVTVSGTDVSGYAQYVIVGMTQSGNVILLHVPKAQISERDDITWTVSDLLQFNMTLRMYKGPETAPYMFKAWGLAEDIAAAA